MSAAAIVPITSLVAPQLPAPVLPAAPATGGGAADFSGLLTGGLQKVNEDVLDAEKLSREFAVSDSMPVHQVTYALEQAQLSLNLMVQVRNRLLEGYQQLMNMQL